MTTRVFFLGAIVAAVVSAGPVTVASYSMPNGETGTWLYRDEIYLPCPGGACTTSLAALSGGSGKLTNGVAPAASWNGSGAPGGTPVPWVGWTSTDPTITVFFSGTTLITRVNLYLDNTPGTGDVRLPDRVVIDGTNYDIVVDANFGPRWLTFDITPVNASSLGVQLFRDQSRWMMLGEMTFEGPTQGIPEPATASVVLTGLAAAILAARRRGKRTS